MVMFFFVKKSIFKGRGKKKERKKEGEGLVLHLKKKWYPWFKEWVPLVLGVGSELEKDWPQAQSWNFWNV